MIKVQECSKAAGARLDADVPDNGVIKSRDKAGRKHEDRKDPYTRVCDR